MKTITLPDDVANDLGVLLANLSPVAISTTAQKCAVLYNKTKPLKDSGVIALDSVNLSIRFSRAIEETQRQLLVRARFELECG